MLTRGDADLIVKSLLDFLEAREGARRFHPSAIGAGVDPAYCLCDFLCRVKKGDAAGLEKVYGASREKVTGKLDETSGTAGGYLLPRPLMDQLFATLEEEAIVRPRATVAPMTRQKLLLGLPDPSVSVSAGLPSYFGGFSMTWTEERADRNETEPAWTQVELTAWELAGVCYASNDWLNDSTAGTEEFLRRLFARACAHQEDQAFFTGDGVGKPLGMKNSACAISVTRATGTDFTAVDAGKMLERLLPSCWDTAAWAVHPSVYQKLTGQAGWQANNPQPDVPKKASTTYHSLPLFVTDKTSALGSAGDVQLFDARLYVVGDRRAVLIDVSADEPTAFLKNQSVFRVSHRVDGRPWLRSSVTPANGSTALSSFVYLT